MAAVRSLLVVILGSALGSMACTRQIAPPAAPPRQRVELETMPEGPIAAGSGRVLLDAEPGKGVVKVLRVDRAQVAVSTTSGGYAQGVAFSTQLVCSKTPCAVDLPAGSHELVFQAARDPRDVSAATFDVTAGRTHVVRHAVGFVDPHFWSSFLGTMSIALGGGSAVGGAIFIPLSSTTDSDGMRTAGVVMLGAGAALVALGIASVVIGRAELQPGATTQWVLPRDGESPQPASTQGGEHARRSTPALHATGNGIGMTW